MLSLILYFINFQGLLMSFCATATPGFSYHFYIAHDHFDPFFRGKGSHVDFTKAFYQQVGWKYYLYGFRLLCITVISFCYGINL